MWEGFSKELMRGDAIPLNVAMRFCFSWRGHGGANGGHLSALEIHKTYREVALIFIVEVSRTQDLI